MGIRIVPYTRRESKLHTNICFVEEGKPCQPNLLKNMINDTDNILTGPGKLNDLLQQYEKAIDALDGDNTPRTQEKSDELGFLRDDLKYWTNRLLQDKTPGMFGKSNEHWSCLSGSCSNNICDSGVNYLLVDVKLGGEDRFPLNSRSSKSVKHMGLISFFFILLSGLLLAFVALRGFPC